MNRESYDFAPIDWLVEQSMLHQAGQIAARHLGQGSMWQHPYADAQPRAAASLASVWFSAYPAVDCHALRASPSCTPWVKGSCGKPLPRSASRRCTPAP